MFCWTWKPTWTKLTLSVRVAVWIRETGSGQPTHLRANSEPAASRATPKGLASPARGAPHTDEFGLLEPEPSRTSSETRTCMGPLRPVRWKRDVSPKRQFIFTGLHGVISQETVLTNFNF
jgi:hypothetical protein